MCVVRPMMSSFGYFQIQISQQTNVRPPIHSLVTKKTGRYAPEI